MTLPKTRPDATHEADHCILLMAILAGVMALQWGTAMAATSPLDSPPLRDTLDPNTAPWWELAVLPRIGPGIARNIVDFRVAASGRTPTSHHPILFESPADLKRIRRIGPKTIQRIRPYLRLAMD